MRPPPFQGTTHPVDQYFIEDAVEWTHYSYDQRDGTRLGKRKYEEMDIERPALKNPAERLKEMSKVRAPRGTVPDGARTRAVGRAVLKARRPENCFAGGGWHGRPAKEGGGGRSRNGLLCRALCFV